MARNFLHQIKRAKKDFLLVLRKDSSHILTLQCLTGLFRTGYPDTMLLAVVSIRSVPVYLVCKYACRIMTCTVFIAFYDILEYLSFSIYKRISRNARFTGTFLVKLL